MKTKFTLVIAAVAVVLLASCTAVRVSYNNADSLMRYVVWRYVDLDPRQSDALQQRLARLHDWHRSNELPAYVDFLHSVRSRFARGLAAPDVGWAIDAMRTHYRITAGHAATEAAPLLLTLSPEQIASIERRFAKEDAKFEHEWLNGSPERRERRAAERLIERFEQWTGDLDHDQQARIRDFVKAHPRDAQLRLQDRRRWQRAAVELVRQYRRAEDLAPRLARLFGEPDSGRSPEYVAEMRRWESDLGRLIVELSRSLSAEQRERVLRRIDRYAEDFQSLERSERASGSVPAAS